MTAPQITTADLLDEYASALRGDWGSIDGRAEKLGLNQLADQIREHGNAPLTAPAVAAARDGLGLCPGGSGHWTWHCDAGCPAAPTTTDATSRTPSRTTDGPSSVALPEGWIESR